MKNTIIMDLSEIQPSQLYINLDKLENVLKWFDPNNYDSYDAIPVKKLNGKIIFTDGHTRAYAAYMNGVKNVKVYWDTDDLDWNAYEICVEWCNSEGIVSIKDLKNRIITSDKYEILWLQRCKHMHNKLEQNL